MISNILFILLVFFANIIQTVSGFAGAMITVPAGMHLVGLDQTRAVSNIVGLMPSVVILAKDRKAVRWREALKIILLMLVGMIAGWQLTRAVASEYLVAVYAVLIIVVALRNLLSRKAVRLAPFAEICLLLAAGVIHGMFTSGGSLLVIYCLNKFKDKTEFRATLAAAWIVLGSVLFFIHLGSGLVDSQTLWLSLVCLPALVLAIWLGNRIYHKINEKTFYRFVNILLLACGVLLFF